MPLPQSHWSSTIGATFWSGAQVIAVPGAETFACCNGTKASLPRSLPPMGRATPFRDVRGWVRQQAGADLAVR